VRLKSIEHSENIEQTIQQLFEKFHQGKEQEVLSYLKDLYQSGERQCFSEEGFVHFLQSLSLSRMPRLSFRETDIYQWWLNIPADQIDFKKALGEVIYYLMKDDIAEQLRKAELLNEQEEIYLRFEELLRSKVDDIYRIKSTEFILFNELSRKMDKVLRSLVVTYQINSSGRIYFDDYQVDEFSSKLSDIKKMIGAAYIEGQISLEGGQEILNILKELQENLLAAVQV